ncbi:hypothetical protein BVY04_01625 [bacterium M21]|nr:hypothetical protein BVY04_01625 [bacterium M21]
MAIASEFFLTDPFQEVAFADAKEVWISDDRINAPFGILQVHFFQYPLRPTNIFDQERLKVKAERMNDFSRLVSEFQQQFTTWYNRVRCKGRRGTLWADRVQSVLVDGKPPSGVVSNT